jgi:hypothetical protein
MSDAEFDALPGYSDIESRLDSDSDSDSDSDDVSARYGGYLLAATSLDGAGPDNFGRVADSLAGSPAESFEWPPTPEMYSQTYRLLDGDNISTLDRSLIGIPSLGGASVASLPPPGIRPPPGFSPTPHHIYSFDTPSLLALNPDYRIAGLNISPRGSSGTTFDESALDYREEEDTCLLHIGDGLPPRDPQRQSIARTLDGQRYPWIITPGRPRGRACPYLQDGVPYVSMRGGAGSEHELHERQNRVRVPWMPTTRDWLQTLCDQGDHSGALVTVLSRPHPLSLALQRPEQQPAGPPSTHQIQRPGDPTRERLELLDMPVRRPRPVSSGHGPTTSRESVFKEHLYDSPTPPEQPATPDQSGRPSRCEGGCCSVS